MGRLPLEGIRVVDFSWIIAGPIATRFLAMMGAEVIKVGSARRPDPSTNSAAFQAYNQSKKYCALNLSKPEGVDLAKRLVGVADVVVENFAVGVFERLGLTYEMLREVRPDAYWSPRRERATPDRTGTTWPMGACSSPTRDGTPSRGMPTASRCAAASGPTPG